MNQDQMIVDAWRRQVEMGVPPMTALTNALDEVGVEGFEARGRVLDSGLFVGWPPRPRDAMDEPGGPSSDFDGCVS